MARPLAGDGKVVRAIKVLLPSYDNKVLLVDVDVDEPVSVLLSFD